MHNVERLFGGGWSRFVDEVIELGTAVTRFHQIARIVSRFLERGNSIKWKLVGPELWLDCSPHPISRCTFGLVGWRYIYSSSARALFTVHLRSLWFLDSVGSYYL